MVKVVIFVSFVLLFSELTVLYSTSPIYGFTFTGLVVFSSTLLPWLISDLHSLSVACHNIGILCGKSEEIYSLQY